MATNTPNYNLVKPDGTEFADIDVLNDNSDKIDTAIKEVSNKISSDGTLNSLQTFDKTSLVNATNEVNSRSIIGLGYNDVRGILRTPSYYYNEAVTNTIYEFKEFFDVSDLGLSNSYGSFANVETKVPYRDSSGGSIKQVAYTDNGTLIRKSINDTSWGAWSKELTTDVDNNLLQDLTISKNIPYLRLQTPNNTKSFEARLNANDTNDYGLDFYRNGNIYQRVFNDMNVQFKDTSGNYFSIQSLKQDCSDAFDIFAAAITAKGVPTAAGSNRTTILNNINAIPTTSQPYSTQGNRSGDILAFSCPFNPRLVTVKSAGSINGAYGFGTYQKPSVNTLYVNQQGIYVIGIGTIVHPMSFTELGNNNYRVVSSGFNTEAENQTFYITCYQ